MIVEVKTYKEQEEFARLGVEFSRTYPNAIPYFYKEQLNFLNSDKNYVLRNGGKLNCFLCKVNDAYVGRVAAMINSDIPDTGLVGLFDCIEDYSVAESLLDSAKEYLLSENCKRILGPIDFSIFQSYRFMTDGYSNMNYLGEPRNPSYYPMYFKDYGFSKENEWESSYMDKDEMITFRDSKKEQFDLYTKLGYYFIELNDHNKDKLMDATYELLIKAYSVFPVFNSISKKDFLEEYNSMPDIMDRKCSAFLFNPRGEMLGFLILLKDLSKAIIKMNGKTDALAKLRFLMNKNQGGMVNIAQGASLSVHIREAAVLGIKNYGTPMSLTDATFYYCVGRALESKKYNKLVISLVRKGAEIRKHYSGFGSQKSHYAIYKLNLNHHA